MISSHCFKWSPEEYRNLIIRLLTTEQKEAIVSGLKKYVPTLENSKGDRPQAWVNNNPPPTIDEKTTSSNPFKNFVQRFNLGKNIVNLIGFFSRILSGLTQTGYK